jgi:hypothetical protein
MVDKTVADLNPRAQATKSMEMTVLRALQLIEAFDALEEGQDWTDVPNPTYRRIIGPRYEHGRMLEEVYNRWKSGTLYREVLALYANLPPDIWNAKPGDTRDRQKELKWRRDGINRINLELDSRGKGKSPRPAARGNGRRRTKR